MKKAADRGLAEQQAAAVLAERQIKSLPVDPIALASATGIVVQAMPSSGAGVSGMLLFTGNSFGILYATHIDSDGFRNFSVAHELGHYFLPGHPDALFPSGSGEHRSRAGVMSSDPYETEADHFAAALLMPDPYFTSALRRCKDDGLAAVEHLRNLCRTSTIATAIRYAERATVPVAVIASAGQRIDFAFLSKAMQDFQVQWPRKGTPVPGGTLTEAFNREPANITEGRRETGSTTMRDWFGFRRGVALCEEVLGLGQGYGKTLTVLTSDTFADDDAEDEDLEESWRVKWR